jgi:hypothetical protein
MKWADYQAGNYTAQQTTQTTPGSTQQAPSTPQPQTSEPTARLGLTEKNIKGITSQLFAMFQADRERSLPKGVSEIPALEEVEVVGEKVNYKVALNPDVFWRFNVFKAQNQRLTSMGKAKPFQGDFSDFLNWKN